MRAHPLRACGLLLLAACASARNYLDPEGPRHAGPAPPTAAARAAGAPIRIVSFNVQYAVEIDRAIALLTTVPELAGADIVLLQEMDASGVERIARALSMAWVYYPATISPTTNRDFGNAVLSRFPIIGDHKILLPHRSRFTGTRRIATAATVAVDGTSLRLYSVHLGTIADIGPGARADQLRTVLADAASFPVVVVGGDLNSHGVGEVAEAAGFAWPTEHGPRTARLGRWDHLFLKGIRAPDSTAVGTVRDLRGASDHRPVWMVMGLDTPGGPARTDIR